MAETCTTDILRDCIPYFETLKDEQRLSILMNLTKDKQLTVGELADRLNLSVPAVSYHLKMLTQNGLVATTKVGTKKYHRLTLTKAIQHLKELTTSLETLANEA